MVRVIWQKTTSLICKGHLVDTFHHIRQVAAVAARVTKLVLCTVCGPFGTLFGGKGRS